MKVDLGLIRGLEPSNTTNNRGFHPCYAIPVRPQ